MSNKNGSSAKTKRKSFLRNLVSLIFSFFLSLVLVGISLLTIVQLGVLRESSILSVLDKEYYKACLKTIEDEAYYYTLPTGIDGSVLTDVFTHDELKYDVDMSLREAFAGKEYEPDTTLQAARLRENTHRYLQESNAQLTDDADEIVDAYVDEIMEIYRTYAVMPGLEYLIKAKEAAGNYLLIGIAVLTVFALLLIIAIIKLHEYKHRSFRYLAYAFGGAALMCSAAPGLVYFTDKYKGLNLAPEYFYRFVLSIVEQLLKTCLFAGVIWLIAMVLTIVMVVMMRRGAMSPGGSRPLHRQIRRNRRRRRR